MILDRAIHKQAEIDIYQIHKTKVLRTYLNGKLVHENEKASKNIAAVSVYRPTTR